MAKFKLKSVLLPTLALVVICGVISGALAYTNSITKDKIAKAEKEKSKATMAQIFTDNGCSFTEKTYKKINYTVVENNGKTVGYIFTASNQGYGGSVSVMTGVNTDGTVKAVRVLSVSDETPGLGQTATEQKFTSKFEGKSGKISTEKNKEIDALTGATITTTAVIKDVNTALEYFNQVKGAE